MSDNPATPETPPGCCGGGSPPETAGSPRREFFKKALAMVIGGLVTLVPPLAGLAFFFDPVARKRKNPLERPPVADEHGFIRVTTTDLLPADGQPQKFTVIADQLDAWNYFPERRVGNVILRKVAEGAVEAGEDVAAFSDVCPHLGCKVNFQPGASEAQAFKCPCHDSAFSLSGERSNEIPPRDLDRMEVQVRNGNEIWVRYQKFRVGERKQIPVS